MIKGFERETFTITDEEVGIASTVLDFLIEKAEFVTNSDIGDFVQLKLGIKLKQARIRKVIHYVRSKFCHTGFVIATSDGYKFSVDIKELNEYKTSLHQRIGAQVHIYNELENIIDRKER